MRDGIVGLAWTLLLATSACSGDGTGAISVAAVDSTLPAQTTPVPSTTTGVPATIPDGTYSRIVVREDAIAAGFDPELVDKYLEADGRLPMAIKVAGNRWTHFVTSDSGIAEIGDAGTAGYDDDGHWVLVNPSGRVLSYEWSLHDGSLTLTIVASNAPGEVDRPPDDDERLITEDLGGGTMKPTTTGVVLSSLLLIAAVAACRGDSEASFEPTLQWGACPGDVEVTFLSRHECGTLTVLEDRDEPDGRTVELLVVKVWPVGVEPGAGIHTGFGANIGDPLALTGSIATGATRLGAIAVNMEIRGAGPHSTPSLRCPETDELAVQAARQLTGDPDFTAAFVASIEACAKRLRAAGVDPADYDIGAIAADADDLRRALDLDRWWLLGTQGTMSRATFEYLRAYPDRADGAYVDSPWFPDTDDLIGGITGTRAALTELFATCAADTVCNDTYPDLDRTWDQALDRLGDAPLLGSFETASGDDIDVVVDAPKLLRAARFALGGDGPTNAGQLPATITAAAAGETTPWLVATIAQDPLFCVGYRPFCTGQDGFSLGAYLTAFCRDQAPFVDVDTLNAAVDGDPVYEAVFVHSPYRQACEAWDVPAADPAIAQPVDTDVPLLMLPGQFDSFSPPAAAEARAGALSMAWTVTVPGQTHNTLGFAECAITARNQWAQEPTVPPDEDACSSAPPLAFSTDS